MKILPLRTVPPQVSVERRHTPPETTGRYGYQEYRPCLRWDFGFTCAFCLLHEGDLADLGAKGMGLTWIEHFIPASLDEEKINEYANCFYTCLSCNRSRASAAPIDAAGRKLINPCSHAWAERFFPTDDDRLLADMDDPDAVYTAETYDLNDPRKVERRRLRRERLAEWLAVVREGPLQVQSLISLSETVPSLTEAEVLLSVAASLRNRILRAVVEIKRYVAAPINPDEVCRCGRKEYCELPEWLATQTQELDAK
jgi:hypothetical protein